MEISYFISWRRDVSWHSPWCDYSTVGRLLRGEGSLQCFAGCSGTISSLSYVCSDYSYQENWSFGGYQVTYDFSRHGSTTIRVGTSGCCWIAPYHESWNVATTFSLAYRTDIGGINSSPRAITSPVVRLQAGCTTTIALAVNDPDGDVVRCRWGSNSNECGGVCNEFPEAYLNSHSCTITVTSTRTGFRIAALMIEDFATTSSAVPFSSVSLQFLVYIVRFSGSCGQQPEFVDPTLPQNSCEVITSGQTFTTQITAFSGGSSYFIREIVTVSPRGTTKSNVQRIGATNNYYVNIYWTPDSSQQSQTHQFCYAAVNSVGLSSEQICIQIMAGYVRPTANTLLLYISNTSWHITFDQSIQRSSQSADIIFYEFNSDREVYRLDASSSREIVLHQSRTLIVTPSYTFAGTNSYYINIEEGIVQSTQGCRPDNIAVTNGKSYWTIGIPPIIRADSNRKIICY